MKALLLSTKPIWCAKIMNGDKTIEVRKGTALYKAIKKLINEYGYADIYVYCTKDNKNLLHKNCADIYWVEDKDFKAKNKKLGIKTQPYLNGKVVFKFRCYLVEEINYDHDDREEWYATKTLNDRELEKQSCLTYEELDGYLRGKGTAIHISDLEIFDKPKELSEFYKVGAWEVYKEQFDSSYMRRTEQEIMKSLNQTLTKSPKSFMYIEVE